MATTFRITVSPKLEFQADNNRLITNAHHLGIESLTSLQTQRLFFLQGKLSESDAQRIATEILTDPVTEQFSIDATPDGDFIDVTWLPGVTDPAADTLVKTAGLLGITISQAATGNTYLIEGDLADEERTTLATALLSNPVVQQISVNQGIQPPFVAVSEKDSLVETVTVSGTSDADLLRISKERRLSMDLAEMQAIRAYFGEEGREPTDIELEMLAQTWSEHCVHKTFKAKINFIKLCAFNSIFKPRKSGK